VKNITVGIHSSSSVLLTWTPPVRSCWNGILTNYTITIHSLGPQNTTHFEGIGSEVTNSSLNGSHVMVLPDQELSNHPDPRSNGSIEAEVVLLTDLQPFFVYSMSVYMSNGAGDGPPASSELVTLPGTSKNTAITNCYVFL